MVTVRPATVREPASGVTSWVLIVEPDPARARSAESDWEDAGYAVELASGTEDALAFLKVMTPSFVVVEGRTYRPHPR